MSLAKPYKTAEGLFLKAIVVSCRAPHRLSGVIIIGPAPLPMPAQ